MTPSHMLRVAALLAPAFAPAASAQTAPAEAPAAEVGADALPKDAAAQVEHHIKRLHDQLGITPAEQPLWDQFAQVMRSNAAQITVVSNDRGSKLAAMDAADSMKSYANLAQVHANNMQKLAGAFQSLYDSFPDAQKKTADAVFRSAAPTGARKRAGG